MKALYIFSGLGADERVFQRLDFSGYSPTFIKWISPKENEAIEHYAGRLLSQIISPNPVLIGLSFGGIMAIEVSKLIETEKVILISSAKTKTEIPLYFRFIAKLGILKIIPVKLLKKSNFITNWFFGTYSDFEKQMLKQILIETDPLFLHWAIDKIAQWKNEFIPKNSFHIHGTGDRVLPFRLVNCDQPVKNGGHLMVLNKPEELSKIIRRQL